MLPLSSSPPFTRSLAARRSRTECHSPSLWPTQRHPPTQHDWRTRHSDWLSTNIQNKNQGDLPHERCIVGESDRAIISTNAEKAFARIQHLKARTLSIQKRKAVPPATVCQLRDGRWTPTGLHAQGSPPSAALTSRWVKTQSGINNCKESFLLMLIAREACPPHRQTLSRAQLSSLAASSSNHPIPTFYIFSALAHADRQKALPPPVW